MAKVGRPTKYSYELVQRICAEIAQGRPLTHICKDEDWSPALQTIYKWKMEHPEFSELYAQARLDQADYLAEETLKIADDSGVDITVGEDGSYTVNGEAIQRAKLRVDTRKWFASKMRPDKYADLSRLTGPKGTDPVGIAVSTIPPEIDELINGSSEPE